jgi:4-amino-4-deoxy-L-arabinose transferase-like glycosyltransferase
LTRLALALAFLTAALGIGFGTFTAGGSDSYGYVSQADLWLQRTLIINEPLADEAPWRNSNWTLTPFGYRPGDRRGTMVPTYSPGLPMVMAAFKAVGGPNAVYFVVPLLGALTVWLTFVFGRRLAGPPAGLLASTALLASPAFLFQLMWPMSDVPAVAWWLLSIVLAVRGTTWSCAGAGLAAAVAVLTRPNLVVLVVPLLAFVVSRPARMRDRYGAAAVFTCAMLPGAIAVAAINRYLYESAFNSGYGSFSTIYASEHFWPNLLNYAAWLLQTQTPFILLGIAAPLLFHRRGNSEARSIAVLGLGFSATVVASYLWYTPFEDWTYLRFLLPAFPLMLALAASVCVLVASRKPRWQTAMVSALAVTLAVWGVWVGRSAFHVRADEARYVAAGRIGAGLPDNAVILSNQHSGSLRYYAGRITMRFEWLEPDMYVPALEYFARLSRPVYVVLDDWERDIFRSRYAPVADLSWLDRPPLLLAGQRVYFYAVPSTSQGVRP